MEKAYRLHVRMTEATHAKLQNLAKQSGRRQSDVVIDLIESGRVTAIPSAELAQINRQLIRIGTNINQIAQRVHASGMLNEAYYRQQAEALERTRIALLVVLYGGRPGSETPDTVQPEVSLSAPAQPEAPPAPSEPEASTSPAMIPPSADPADAGCGEDDNPFWRS